MPGGFSLILEACAHAYADTLIFNSLGTGLLDYLKDQ
jgi:hypothetical protein